MIADQQEAWYLESYSGHQWCAVKMPEDAVAVFGNESMLGSVADYVEGESLLHSEGLFSVPEAAGQTVLDEAGNVVCDLRWRAQPERGREPPHVVWPRAAGAVHRGGLRDDDPLSAVLSAG